MKTLGFVGTAKNTGKTTAALHMLGLIAGAGYRVALTSIGYDGENTDHITGLPKPRYHAQPGMIVATARKCLLYGTAQYADIIPTSITTILGEIIVARVVEAGEVVLAGPNRRADLRPLLDMLAGFGAGVTLLDGALNRLAAMIEADGMVLSTGAAFDERIEVTTDHAAAMEALFHYPRAALWETAGGIRYVAASGRICEYPLGSVMDDDALWAVSGWLLPGETGELFIPGVFSPHLFERLTQECSDALAGKTFVFTSPLTLLAAGNPKIWQASLARLTHFGAAVRYLYPIPLYFMTVNPFYPEYFQQTASYTARFVDKARLLRSAQEKITYTPVVDILQPPHPDLLSLCAL